MWIFAIVWFLCLFPLNFILSFIFNSSELGLIIFLATSIIDGIIVLTIIFYGGKIAKRMRMLLAS